MYLLISIVHVTVCLILILVILLQAGKGGGLSEMFGGAMTQNQKLFGTETNSFLTKATTYSAIIFIVTCILLGVLTANESRSLVSGRRIQPILNSQTLPADVKAAMDAAATASGDAASTATTAAQSAVSSVADAAAGAVNSAAQTTASVSATATAAADAAKNAAQTAPTPVTAQPSASQVQEKAAAAQ